MESRLRHAVLAGLWLALILGATLWDFWDDMRVDPSDAVARGAVGIGFAVTAILLWNQSGQRSNARLFALLTLVWLVDEAGLRDLGPLGAVALLVGGYVTVLAAAVLLRYPGTRLDPAARRFITVAAIVATLLQVGLLVTGEFPWDRLGPREQPKNLDLQAGFDLVVQLKSVWLVAAAGIFLWLLGRRWRSMGRLERRTLAPILATAAVAALALMTQLVAPVVPEAVGHTLGLLRQYSAAAVAFAFAASAVQNRLAQTAIADLVTRLRGPVTIDEVRDALRTALADDDLQVLYWVPELAAYVDSTGDPVEVDVTDDRLVFDTPTADGRPLARIVADPSLRRHEGLVAAAVQVSTMALENARLEAGLRSQLLAIQEARARLLHTGLEQRRQLERDLHDGAQQRLLALGMRLGAIEATTRDPETTQAVQAAREELHVALGELRDLAHGLYPAVLTQAGLAPALEAVAERMPIDIELQIPDQRWHPDVESAAYLVACEALANVAKHAEATQASLVVESDPTEIRVSVRDDGQGAPTLNSPESLRGLRDRLAALGGGLDVQSTPGQGTHVLARIPCD